MPWTRRAKSLVAIVTLIVGSTTVLNPASASASASDCAGGANGFVDISDGLSGLTVDEVETREGHFLDLEYGKVNGVTRGWALIYESITEYLPTSASVWMDWSQDSGRTWLQCGPFYNSKGKKSITSAAKQTSSSSAWVFRAGAMVNGKMYLTQWH
jgi:hypothetical protein